MCIVDQTQNFQGMFQVLCCIFILIKKEEGSPKQSRCLKLLNFLVDCSIIDANFCNPYLWYLMHSERCTRIVRHGNFRLCQIFILINKVEGSPKYYGIQNLLIFFVDCNIVEVKLKFVPRHSVVSDVSIEIGMCL